MITVEPVATLGGLPGPIVVSVAGSVQCLLIDYGLQQMAVASKERSRQLNAIEKRIEQRDKEMQQHFEPQSKGLEDIGAGTREAAAGIRGLLQERK